MSGASKASPATACTQVTPHEVRFQNGQAIAYDELIALAPSRAAVRYDGLPMDDRGFLHVAPDNRAVVGFDGLFAPGDAGDFPLKQAYLAFLQSHAVAEAITGALTGEGPREAFDPVSLYSDGRSRARHLCARPSRLQREDGGRARLAAKQPAAAITSASPGCGGSARGSSGTPW